MRFTQGNLLDAKVEAVVNTVNTVGVMGKGIALMFKERFSENYDAYAEACKAGEVQIGKMFVTAGAELDGPRWIINFPTKKHWRQPTKLEWVRSGLVALKDVIQEKKIQSIALPPLGCGNGGLDWDDVRPIIEATLGDLGDVEVVVYEPTAKYQNVAKKKGVEILTAARALIAEMVRRYGVLGIECTLLETQKLAWFLERTIHKMGLEDPLDLRFEANRYGPYANRLTHLLNGLDGSYLHCDKRLADAAPFDSIWFENSKRGKVELFLKTEAKTYLPALEATDNLIDGFQSPLGMEALATVDWLVARAGAEPTLEGIRRGIRNWPTGESAALRKERLFSDRLLTLSLERLSSLLSEDAPNKKKEEKGKGILTQEVVITKLPPQERQLMKEPGLDGRHRDKDGRIDQKRGDTLNKNLSKPIEGFSPNARLDTIRRETGETSERAIREAAKNRK